MDPCPGGPLCRPENQRNIKRNIIVRVCEEDVATGSCSQSCEQYCHRCQRSGARRSRLLSQTEHEAAVLLFSHHHLLALLTRTMSQTHPNASSSSSSSSNFQSVLNAALDAYEKKTKSKLLTHPLAAQLQACDSPTAILSVLQSLIQQFDHRRRSDERLTNWLNPTINVLYAFSSTLGQGVGLVSPNQLSS